MLSFVHSTSPLRRSPSHSQCRSHLHQSLSQSHSQWALTKTFRRATATTRRKRSRLLHDNDDITITTTTFVTPTEQPRCSTQVPAHFNPTWYRNSTVPLDIDIGVHHIDLSATDARDYHFVSERKSAPSTARNSNTASSSSADDGARRRHMYVGLMDSAVSGGEGGAVDRESLMNEIERRVTVYDLPFQAAIQAAVGNARSKSKSRTNGNVDGNENENRSDAVHAEHKSGGISSTGDDDDDVIGDDNGDATLQSCLLIDMDLSTNILRYTQLGTCALMVIRDDKIVHRSYPNPNDAMSLIDHLQQPAGFHTDYVELTPNDLVIAGTDGLFANLSDSQILAFVRPVPDHIDKTLALANNTCLGSWTSDDVDFISYYLANLANNFADAQHSKSIVRYPFPASPHLDDITVVCMSATFR